MLKKRRTNVEKMAMGFVLIAIVSLVGCGKDYLTKKEASEKFATKEDLKAVGSKVQENIKVRLQQIDGNMEKMSALIGENRQKLVAHQDAINGHVARLDEVNRQLRALGGGSSGDLPPEEYKDPPVLGMNSSGRADSYRNRRLLVDPTSMLAPSKNPPQLQGTPVRTQVYHSADGTWKYGFPFEVICPANSTDSVGLTDRVEKLEGKVDAFEKTGREILRRMAPPPSRKPVPDSDNDTDSSARREVFRRLHVDDAPAAVRDRLRSFAKKLLADWQKRGNPAYWTEREVTSRTSNLARISTRKIPVSLNAMVHTVPTLEGKVGRQQVRQLGVYSMPTKAVPELWFKVYISRDGTLYAIPQGSPQFTDGPLLASRR